MLITYDNSQKIGKLMHGKFYSVWEFEVSSQEQWLAGVPAVLDVLQNRDGFIEAHVMRSPDEPNRFAVHATWNDVGSYRRALGSTQSKMVVWPFLADMIDRPTAFEELMSTSPEGIKEYESSLGED